MNHHIARKRFGQNFLQDQSIISQLIASAQTQPQQHWVEIGPGLGALTAPLLRTGVRLDVIELDRDLVSLLHTAFHDHPQLTIHSADALHFDFTALATDAEKLRVIGNLPYNISTPLLFHLLSNAHCIQDMHFMLQKEVVERMVAAPSTSEYGRLSVMLQYRLKMEYLITVPPEAFDPAPKVESAFVRCVPHKALPYPAKNEALFGKLVTAAFGQRRKTLRNTLKEYLDDAGFNAVGIDSGLRAENLSVEQFVAIANFLA